MDSDTFDEIDSSNIFSDVEPEEIHNKWLIGSYVRGDFLMYASGIDSGTFFKFSIEDVHQYLLENCIFKVRRNTFTPLRIIQVQVLKTGEYTVIDKTCWIRLIQRCWRTRIAQYNSDIVLLRKKYLYHREINGHYPMCARLKRRKILGILRFLSH